MDPQGGEEQGNYSRSKNDAIDAMILMFSQWLSVAVSSAVTSQTE